ncbi:hypothetical protein V6Z12_D13G190200 [Gossypium hirsutum]
MPSAWISPPSTCIHQMTELLSLPGLHIRTPYLWQNARLGDKLKLQLQKNQKWLC